MVLVGGVATQLIGSEDYLTVLFPPHYPSLWVPFEVCSGLYNQCPRNIFLGLVDAPSLLPLLAFSSWLFPPFPCMSYPSAIFFYRVLQTPVVLSPAPVPPPSLFYTFLSLKSSGQSQGLPSASGEHRNCSCFPQDSFSAWLGHGVTEISARAECAEELRQ